MVVHVEDLLEKIAECLKVIILRQLVLINVRLQLLLLQLVYIIKVFQTGFEL